MHIQVSEKPSPIPRGAVPVIWSGLVFAAVAALFLAACGSGANLQQSSAQDKFFAHVDGKQGEAWLEEEGANYVAGLPDDQAYAIAKRALKHPGGSVRLFGLEVLYRLGHETEADKAAGDLLIAGDDLTGVAWAWLHSADPTLMQRRIKGICSSISGREGELTPSQKGRLEHLLGAQWENCDRTSD
jgi:hypothetical protein